MIESDDFKSAKEHIRKAIDRRIREHEPKILSISKKHTHLKLKAYHQLKNDISTERHDVISACSDILTEKEKNKLLSIFESEIQNRFFKSE